MATVQDLQFVLTVQNGQFNAAMTQAGQTLQVFNGQLQNVNGSMQVMQQSMLQAGAASLQLQANLKEFSGEANKIFQEAAAGFAEYNKALREVRESTAQLTDGQLPAFEASILAISRTLPVSRVQLLDTAAAMARLGIFAGETSDTIVPAMEKVLLTISKVSTVTGSSLANVGESFGILQNMFVKEGATAEETQARFKDFGNVLTDFSHKTAATGDYLLRFNEIVGNTAKVVGVSFEDMAGFAAAAANMGKSAGQAGLAIQQLFNGAISNAQGFGRAMGTSGAEFKKAFEADPNQAIIAFLEKLSQSTAKYRQELLADIGVSGRSAIVIQGLANNIDKLKASQDLAAEATKNATALDEEAANKAKSLGAQTDILSNSLNSALVNGFKPIKEALAPVVAAVNNLIQAFPGLVAVIGVVVTVAAGLLTAIAGMILGFVAWKAVFGGVTESLTKIGAGLVRFFSSVSLGQKNIDALSASMIRASVAAKQFSTSMTTAGASTATTAVQVDKATSKWSAFGKALGGIAAFVGAGIIIEQIGVKAAELTNKLDGINKTLTDLGANASASELNKAFVDGSKAAHDFDTSIGGVITNMATLGYSMRKRYADLDAIKAAAKAASDQIIVSNNNLNTMLAGQYNNSPANKAIGDLKDALDNKLGPSLEGQEKALGLFSLAMSRNGASGAKALTEIGTLLGKTTEEVYQLALAFDKVGNNTGINSIAANLHEAAKATKELNQALIDEDRANADIKKAVGDVKALREADLKAVIDAGEKTRAYAALDYAGYDARKKFDEQKKAAETRILEIGREQLIIQQKLAEETTKDHPEKRVEYEQAQNALLKEQMKLRDGLIVLEYQFSVAQSERQKKEREAVNSIKDAQKGYQERKAAELEFAATVATSEAQATEFRRAALDARLAILDEETKRRQEALDLELRGNGDNYKQSQLYKDKLAALDIDSNNKRLALLDHFNQETLTKTIAANKKLFDEIAANIQSQSSRGDLFKADENVAGLRNIKKAIDEVAQSVGDEELKLTRIKQLQSEINDIGDKSIRKWIDASKAVDNAQLSILKARDAQKLMVAEAEFKGTSGVINAQLDVIKQRQAGQINQQQAKAQIDAAQRTADLENEIAKRKEKGYLDEKDMAAITKQREDNLLQNAQQSGQLKTKLGRDAFDLQKQLIEAQGKEELAQQKLGHTKEDQAKKDADLAQQREDAIKAESDAYAQMQTAQEAISTLQSQQVSDMQDLSKLEDELATKMQTRLDLAKQIADAKANGEGDLLGNAQAANPVAPAVNGNAPNAAVPAAPTVPGAATPDVTKSLAGVTDATSNLQAALSTASDTIVNAANTLSNAAGTIGDNIQSFTSKTVTALTTMSDSLANLNGQMTDALAQLDNINQSMETVGA
jgi:TP901 family phage tail tape measure protein